MYGVWMSYGQVVETRWKCGSIDPAHLVIHKGSVYRPYPVLLCEQSEDALVTVRVAPSRPVPRSETAERVAGLPCVDVSLKNE